MVVGFAVGADFSSEILWTCAVAPGVDAVEVVCCKVAFGPHWGAFALGGLGW